MLFLRPAIAVCIIIQAGSFSCGQNTPACARDVCLLEKGLVVERITKNTQAERAGVRSGDVLLAWKRGSAAGNFDSPFDRTYVFLEQADRGAVTIEAARHGSQIKWIFGSDSWGLSVRPNFKGVLLSIYEEAEELATAGKLAEASEHYKKAATFASSTVDPRPSLWLLAHAGSVLADAEQWDLSEAYYQEAIGFSAEAGPIVRGELFRQLASVSERRNNLNNATKYYRQALVEWEKIGRETIAESNILLPLGIVALNQGDFDGAQDYLSRAMTIQERYSPTSIHALVTQLNLAVLCHHQGRFDRAEEDYLRAVDGEEKHFPGTIHLARTLSDLAVLLNQEGDPTRAEVYAHRALRIAQRLAPGSLDVAHVLTILADCAFKKGNVLEAQKYQERALAINEKIAPGGLDSAYSLEGLGRVARHRNSLNRAEEYYRQALALVEKINAPPHAQAGFIIGLAATLRKKGDLTGAEDRYRQALALIDKNEPGGIDRPDVLADLAGTVYLQDRKDDAAQLYQQAFLAMETQIPHLGHIEETRSRYRAKHIRYYREYENLLVEQRQIEQAFETLEGSRARTLLEMLTQAHVDVAPVDDPTQRQRERKLRWLLNAKSEYRIRLGGTGRTEQQLASLDAEISDLLMQYQQTVAELRANSPGYAALTEPQRMSVPQAQQLLDGNTIVLEYSLGEERSHLWAVSRTLLVVYDLARRTDIERAAYRVHDLMTRRNRPEAEPNIDSDDRECQKALERLSRMLLGPVAHLLKQKRLVIIADGALQYVPFSALPSLDTKPVPLMVNHEIVILPSLSILAEIRSNASGRRQPSGLVAVLADPVFDGNDERVIAATRSKTSKPTAAAISLTRSAADVGLHEGLPRLIYTREEADAVMRTIPDGKGLKATDFGANRALATNSLLAKYRIVHFATHGFLNNRHPELSGLVLALVDEHGKPKDGFLKLQDIYNLKLPVDLVVLSGCSTGIGQEISGEGLISLTRGFIYAGASRVIASLWNVNDRATASLMAELYRSMEEKGMRPAAALRAAQIQMWKDSRWHAPYYWASFQIQGEWR